MLSFFSLSWANMPVFDLANYLENIAIAKNTLDSLTKEAEQIKYQLQNLTPVENYQFRDISPLIKELDGTVSQGQAVAYSMSNLDAAFKQRYPDYLNAQGQKDYTKAYKTWSAATLDTLKNTLEAAGINAGNFSQEETMLAGLKAQAKSASGRMQVQQALAEFAAENVNQLQELKRIVAAQTSAQNAFMAEKASKAAYKEQSMEEMSQKIDTKFPPYRDNPNFGKIKCKY